MHTRRFWATDSDANLASLATRAAVALDNKILERVSNLAAINRLAESIRQRLSTPQTFDRTMTLAVNDALIALPCAAPAAGGLAEPIKDADRLIQRLSALAGGQVVPSEELVELRSFCVALARSAAAFQASPYDKPDHTP